MDFKTAPARIIIILLVLFTLPPLTGCSNNMAGAVSETTNGAVSTTLIGSDDQILESAEITLIPRDYLFDEDSSAAIHSCSLHSGTFTFKDKISSGDYNLHIKSENFSHVVETFYDSLNDSFTNIADSIYLKEAGSFSGEILVTERVLGETLFVRPRGFDLYAVVDEYGMFNFPKLPAGEIEFQISKRESAGFNESIFDNFTRNIVEVHHDSGFQILPNSDFRKNIAVVRNIFDINDMRDEDKVYNGSKYWKDSSFYFNDLEIDTLPSAIKHLYATSIDFSGNDLTNLPPEIFHIENMDSLNLSNNELTSIPATIADAQSLRYLDLQNNNITNLPIEITTMDSLSIRVRLNLLDDSNKEINDWLDEHALSPNWLIEQKQSTDVE